MPSLGDALAWLDRHVNLEAIDLGIAGKMAAPDLGRISTLMSSMGDPQRNYPVIHVTGTNGKGSTSRLTALLLETQGLLVGTYVSPHLEAVNERISLNGEAVTDAAFAELLFALEELESFLLSAGPPARLVDPPTWFEIVTAAAYRFFGDVAVGAAVVEVGLGGRFDATNVADGAVAVVTNVELDHVELLGSTRAAIAGEKAGIVKPGAVVVVGESDPEIAEIVAEEGRRVEAEALWRRDVDFACVSNALAYGGRLLDLRTPGASYDDVFLSLHGAHQGENASAALAAAEAFFGAPLEESVVAEAFGRAKVPGRLEVAARRPLVLLDGAHNLAGAAALGAALADDFAAVGRILVVMGCLRGRDPKAMLEAIGLERCALVVGCVPPSLRALPAGDVREAAERLGIAAAEAETTEDAVSIALAAAEEDDLVLVTGSLYVVGSARSWLRRRS